jgi:hypothetical protein
MVMDATTKSMAFLLFGEKIKYYPAKLLPQRDQKSTMIQAVLMRL